MNRHQMKAIRPGLLFLWLISLLLSGVAGAQTQVTIGTGTGSGTSTPFSRFYEYSVSESVYLGSELGTTGNITAIAYDKAAGNSTASTPGVTIYMKLTNVATVGSNTYTGSLNGYTQVWTGSFPNSASGWQEVILDAPFPFPATSQNLSVLVVNNSGSTISTGRPQFRYTTQSSLRREADYTGVTAWDGSQSLIPHWERPNIRLTFGPLSACLAPSGLGAGSVTYQGATLSWLPTAAAPEAYDWEIRTAGTPGSGATGLADGGSTSTTTASSTALLPETTYYGYVRSRCSPIDNSLWSGSIAFTTPCAPVSTFPWIATFETAALPACWSNTSPSSKKWELVAADAAHGAAAPHSGSGMARIDVYNTATLNNPMILQLPPLRPAAGMQLRYWAWIGSGSAAAPLSVMLSADGGSTYSTLFTHNNTTDPNSWKEYSLSLAAYAGQAVLIRFVATSNYGSGTCNINLDDIAIAATTPLPVQLQRFTGHNEGQVNRIEWTAVNEAAGDTYTLERSPDGMAFSEITRMEAQRAQQSVYQYEDKVPFGTAYYRLKMTDEAGVYTYSAVVTVSRRGEQAEAAFAVYPNPATNEVTVRLNNTTLQNQVFYMKDLYGRTVAQWQFSGTTAIRLSLAVQPAGTYYILSPGGTSVRLTVLK